jgi:methyl coenzyme M reductase subunit C-like uncharacterized protein (methanogenesis marker protein 7)
MKDKLEIKKIKENYYQLYVNDVSCKWYLFQDLTEITKQNIINYIKIDNKYNIFMK